MFFVKFVTLHWPLILFVAAMTVAGIQIFYTIFFFARLAFYKQKLRLSSQSHAVSVIVCARDEAENLTVNLPGILVQDYKSTHEVLVVNDNSYDETKYILESLSKEFRQLKVIDLTQEAKGIQGKKFPLSIGIKTAKYEIVLLTDADCVPASEFWIDRMQSVYKDNTEIVLGYGAYQKKKGMLNKMIRWETYHAALQYMSYALAGIPYMGVGRNLSYRKAVFYRHKGFSAHNNISGGDDDLFINMAANKKNTAISTDPESFTISKPATSWEQWKRQKMRHYSTSKYYKAKHKFLLGLYSLTQFLYYPLIVTAAVFYNWEIVVAVAAFRIIAQGIVSYKTMNKLEEKDLFPYFLFFDIWMFFYYLMFVPALFKKPRESWK